ncbi:MAG: nucleotidyl transferase AbiEii/AbiGii toxin family protein [Candidatus Peribacteraceae bacterium]|nr:nucleotidyl transferase AbiEii/AbiGii toxin family protein [Candidatus Peribacteraceae bacterium]MDD5742976.1 nucleotidyl transferase AbiEii/AbiGii toxin family protein [Candidatus Peribacteraceae bacterium]
MNPYGRIFQALNEGDVRYLVVGGVAMNLLGYPRFTGDIDILLALDKNNLKRMAQRMKHMGYEKRLPVEIDELGDEKKVLTLMKKKGLQAYTFINTAEPQCTIDVIMGASLHFEKYQKHHVTIDVWNIPIPVVSIDDLIGMKKSTNRRKDAEDVVALLELKGQ